MVVSFVFGFITHLDTVLRLVISLEDGSVRQVLVYSNNHLGSSYETSEIRVSMHALLPAGLRKRCSLKQTLPLLLPLK